MDVDRRVPLEERGSEQVHVPGADDQLDARAPRATRPWPGRAPPGSRSPPAEDAGGDPGGLGAGERPAPATFDATAAIGRRWSMSACRLEPRPETRTPITRVRPATPSIPSSSRPIAGSRPYRRPPGHDRAEADAEVEDPPLLVLGHPALVQPGVHGRPLPALGVERAPSPAGTARGRFPGRPPPVTWASARTSQRAPQLPDVVEVEPRRREQEVGVEVVVAEDAADEREPVRVQAARRQADDHVPGSQREPSTRSARRTSPTIVPAKSSSPRGRSRAARPSRRRGSRSRHRGRRRPRRRRARRRRPGRASPRRRSPGRRAARRRP